MGFWAWFRDVHRPLSRKERSRSFKSPEETRRARRERYRDPHYYVLHYPPGKRPGSRPKEYTGPFDEAEGHSAAQELARFLRSRHPEWSYKVRRLTADQFEEIWGAPPIPPEEQ
jgi:hypothetical protein